MKLIYGIKSRPKFSQLIVFAFQQILAVMTATIAVPLIVGIDKGLSPQAAMFGAGAGTCIYCAFTRLKSPAFVSSSFAYIGSMFAAFAGGVSMQLGLLGLFIGSCFSGIVYVIIAMIVKVSGSDWINKLLPPVVIGPVVAIIGLSLAGNAASDLVKPSSVLLASNPELTFSYSSLIVGLITLFLTMYLSVYGNNNIKLMPFFLSIVIMYFVCIIITIIGRNTNNLSMQLSDLDAFNRYMYPETPSWVGHFILSVPEFTFQKMMAGVKELKAEYLIQIFVAYAPVALVSFSEHLADHKNLSSIIGHDLFKDPGLDNTLLGDGVGSIVGAFFGGCPNTTYGESVACVAITRNASTITILLSAVLCIVLSFVTPFVAFINSIPTCIMGGVCALLYGFIAVSGLKMIQKVDLDDNSNLFVVSVILIFGIGGLVVRFGAVTLTEVAVALILGVISNIFLHMNINNKSKKKSIKKLLKKEVKTI